MAMARSLGCIGCYHSCQIFIVQPHRKFLTKPIFEFEMFLPECSEAMAQGASNSVTFTEYNVYARSGLRCCSSNVELVFVNDLKFLICVGLLQLAF